MNDDADSTDAKGNNDLFRAAVVKRKAFMNKIEKVEAPNEKDLDDQIEAYFTNAIV
jgi:hypothetical protein